MAENQIKNLVIQDAILQRKLNSAPCEVSCWKVKALMGKE